LDAGDRCIAICPDPVRKRARELRERIKDLNIETTSAYFRVAAWHELGHHLTFSGISRRRMINVLYGTRDANLDEGLANLFAFHLAGPEERMIIAEVAAEGRVAYRSYLILRYLDTRPLLRTLIANGDYSAAFSEFASLVGGKIQGPLNLWVKGRIDAGAIPFMDFSSIYDPKMNLLAGKSISALGPIKGLILTPLVGRIDGRLPA